MHWGDHGQYTKWKLLSLINQLMSNIPLVENMAMTEWLMEINAGEPKKKKLDIFINYCKSK